MEDQVKTGHFSNASYYVRDLIRRDQEYQDKREALVKALIAGETSGVSKRSLEEIWTSSSYVFCINAWMHCATFRSDR